MYVAQHDAHAFFAAQLLFVGTFYAEFTNVVATPVIFVGIVAEFAFADFADIAQYVCAHVG